MVKNFRDGGEVKHLFVDLDETLYSNPAVVEFMVREIRRFIEEKLGFSETEAKRISRECNQKHGTTMAGLVAGGYDFSVEEYQRDVHALDYESLIQPDPCLKELLMQIEQPMYIFTNGDTAHAKRCIQRLEMEDMFQGIFSYDSVQELARNAGMDLTRRVVCKPHPETYLLAMRAVGAHPATTLFIDDSVRNIRAAKELGMQTLLVNPSIQETALQCAASLMDLPRFYPSLFSQQSEQDNNNATAV